MNPPGRPCHWLEYKYLSRWLSIATKGLSDESKARVHEEVTAHFHDAIDERIRAGLAEDIAAEQAVEGLGNPRRARRGFRRTYLTHWQANMVSSFVDAPKPRASTTSLTTAWAARQRSKGLRGLRGDRRARLFVSGILVLAGTVGVALDPRKTTPEWFVRAGMVALMAVAAIVVATAVPSLFRRGRERAAIALGASAEFTLWGAFMMLPATNFESRAWYLLVFVVFFAAVYLPLLRKLGECHEST